MRIIGYSNGNRLFIVITSKSSFVNDNYNIFAPRIKHRFSRYCFSDCFYARDDDDDDEQQVSYTVNTNCAWGSLYTMSLKQSDTNFLL